MSRSRISTLVFGAAVICTAIGGLLLAPMLPQSLAGQDEDERIENGAIRVEAGEDETPHAHYLRLIEKKLKIMTADELGDEIQKLQMELSEREAFQKLEQARQQLEELTQRYPNSQAAQAAHQMLRAGNQGRRRGNDFGIQGQNPFFHELTPVPDPVDSLENPFSRTQESDDDNFNSRPVPQPRQELNEEEPSPIRQQRRKPNISPEQFRRPRSPNVDNNS